MRVVMNEFEAKVADLLRNRHDRFLSRENIKRANSARRPGNSTAENTGAFGHTNVGLGSIANLRAQHYQRIQPLVVNLSPRN